MLKLIKAMNFLKKERNPPDNRLKISLQIARFSRYKCFECGYEFEVEEEAVGVCPSCGSDKTEIMENTAYIRRIEVE